MSSTTDREKSLISANKKERSDITFRPEKLEHFIGQKTICDNIGIFVSAAKRRKEPLDHVLLYGPPGLGKTTLAKIISNELGVGFRSTSGPAIQKTGDLAALLTSLELHDILFIDEIHRLNSSVEEILYPAMEDLHLDIIIGEGPSARSVKIDLQPFTLIGATTRAGLVSNPLRDRFGIPTRLEFYNIDDLKKIVLRATKLLNLKIDDTGALEIACRARGTPRVANRLVRRLRDIVTNNYDATTTVNKEIANKALFQLGIDTNGLDQMDQNYLRHLIHDHSGGPVGLDTLAAQLGEQKDVVEDVIEPYLIQKGFIQKTTRGRSATETALKNLDLKNNDKLFNNE
ncbi:MAG: Holliday junction ATP-dependent DNA helicase RuvB [Alphaproteobacteria bacterium MarineAlpha9_Bin1]|nr:MAG: Holliday junction ATP-dependent DNA helicase RuvB [Alphaproteobacteria bacterium MarineAlpha9_Bin1]